MGIAPRRIVDSVSIGQNFEIPHWDSILATSTTGKSRIAWAITSSVRHFRWDSTWITRSVVVRSSMTNRLALAVDRRQTQPVRLASQTKIYSFSLAVETCGVCGAAHMMGVNGDSIPEW